jgi:hypothetical protein
MNSTRHIWLGTNSWTFEDSSDREEFKEFKEYKEYKEFKEFKNRKRALMGVRRQMGSHGTAAFRRCSTGPIEPAVLILELLVLLGLLVLL